MFQRQNPVFPFPFPLWVVVGGGRKGKGKTGFFRLNIELK